GGGGGGWGGGEGEGGFGREWGGGGGVVWVQLDPPLGGNSSGLLEVSSALRDSGLVGWVDINDNATARAGMSSLMVSAAIERQAGVETVPHLPTRARPGSGPRSRPLGPPRE